MIRRAAMTALVVLFLIFPLALYGQSRSTTVIDSTPRVYSIRGNVRYQLNERAAEMVKIELRKFSGEVVSATFTRSNGEFEFSGLSTGTYYVVVEEQGYELLREAIEILTNSRYGVLLYLKNTASVEPGETGTSISAHELSMPPKARESYQKGVELLYDKKNYAGSVVQFQRAVKDAPNFYEAHFRMGIAYNELNRPADAEQSFIKSIELSQQKFADPMFALGSMRCSQQKFTEAEAMIRRGIALDAKAWQGHYELARALFGQNRLDEADRSVVEVLQRRTDFASAYLLRANIRIRQKNYAALIADLDEYLRLEPDGPYSAQARQMREQIRRAMDNAKANTPPPPPKP